MSGNKSRGDRPVASKASFAAKETLTSHDDETPKFCLHFVAPGFDVHALDVEKQAALAKTLQKLSASRWKDLKLAPRRGQGSELIPASQIKASIPPQFQDEPKFMVFRYCGKLPMAGIRIRDVYHVIWIEPEYGRLYSHG
jgi:hypothetical protein